MHIFNYHILFHSGLTETCGLATNGFPDEMSMLGTVGPPFVYSELRLEEVPEMGYNPLGNPPRGEICMRGKSTFAGYYKNPELTSETLRDGWFHTGGTVPLHIQPLSMEKLALFMLFLCIVR